MSHVHFRSICFLSLDCLYNQRQITNILGLSTFTFPHFLTSIQNNLPTFSNTLLFLSEAIVAYNQIPNAISSTPNKPRSTRYVRVSRIILYSLLAIHAQNTW